MANQDRRIDGALFRSTSTHPQAPKLSGTLKLPQGLPPGEYKIAIFGPRQSAKGNEYFNIVEDTWKPQQQGQSANINGPSAAPQQQYAPRPQQAPAAQGFPQRNFPERNFSGDDEIPF